MNLQLLKETRGWVASGGDDQYKWDQRLWSCCVAGYVVAKAVGITHGRPANQKSCSELNWNKAGREALGVSHQQASALFHYSNSQEKVLRILDRLIREAEADNAD